MKLTQPNTKSKHDLKIILSTHIGIILVFLLLTIIFTYPGYISFNDRFLGPVQGDGLGWLWYGWYFSNAITNPDWGFVHSNIQFYPIGFTLIVDSVFLATFATILYPVLNQFALYNTIVFFSFVSTGYTTFLLANYLTKNIYASVIAGVIFTFSYFHLVHQDHLNLSVLTFLPLFTLFLLKTGDNPTFRNSVITGVLLFMTFASMFYIGFFAFTFFIIFILYKLFKKQLTKELSLKLIIVFLIFFIISSIIFFPLYHELQTNPSFTREPGEFITYSTDLVNFARPMHNTNIAKLFPDYSYVFNWGETSAFLGYTAISLGIIGIIYSRSKSYLWIFAAAIFAIISMGPILRIAGYSTDILLITAVFPDIPILSSFRTIGRAAVMTLFSVSILSSFGALYIFQKIKFKKKYLVLISVLIIGAIIYENSWIPYPTNEEISVPPYYNEIARDPRSIAVLVAPFGGMGETGLMGNYKFSEYQRVHEKPIISGWQNRVNPNIQSYIDTYFFDNFIWYNADSRDIIDQKLNDVGINILNYYNIGYVNVHNDPFHAFMKNRVLDVFYPNTKAFLYEIFEREPDYQDDHMISYKVTKSDSQTPFLLLGEGWNQFYLDSRTSSQNSKLVIINPNNEVLSKTILLELGSPIDNKLSIFFNGDELTNFILEKTVVYKITIGLELSPGKNELVFTSDNTTKSGLPKLYDKNISLVLQKISLHQNEDNSNFLEVDLVNDQSVFQKIDVGSQVNDMFLKILGRNADHQGLEGYTNSILYGGKDLSWLENVFLDSSEYKNKLKNQPKKIFN